MPLYVHSYTNLPQIVCFTKISCLMPVRKKKKILKDTSFQRSEYIYLKIWNISNIKMLQQLQYFEKMTRWTLLIFLMIKLAFWTRSFKYGANWFCYDQPLYKYHPMAYKPGINSRSLWSQCLNCIQRYPVLSSSSLSVDFPDEELIERRLKWKT